MDPLTKLIDGDIRGSADKYLTTIDLRKVIYDGCGGDCFSSPRRSLYQTKWLLKYTLNGVDLAAIQLRQARYTKLLW